MSGASGVQSNLDGTHGRALIFAVQETFGSLKHSNSPTSCEVGVKASDIFPKQCKAKENVRLLHTDSSKYVAVYMPGSQKEIMKNMVANMISYLEEMQDEQNTARMLQTLLGEEGRALADI